MKMKDFNKYFGGRYMRYWYVAFVLVMGWFILNLFNNSSVTRYMLTYYDANGNVLDSAEVSTSTMNQPETLPISKSYTPIKPVIFLR